MTCTDTIERARSKRLRRFIEARERSSAERDRGGSERLQRDDRIMATVSKNTRTPGSILASERFDAAVEDGIAGRPARYPNGAAFVAEGRGHIVTAYARRSMP
jgi:hypothetical protein